MENNIAPLVAQREAVDTYRIDNGRGAELRIGLQGDENSFSPLELLQAALAGCVALSAERQLESKLGENFDASVAVTLTLDETGKLATNLEAMLTADASALDAEAVDRLRTNTQRVIDRLCAVKRSLNAGIEASSSVQL